MAWVMCPEGSNTWANIWHLSSENANYPRNPAMWWRNDGTFWPCHTSENGADTNLYF